MPCQAMGEIEEEHKKNLEARLASIDVKQKPDDLDSTCPPGRRLFFASDEYAAPV